MKRSHNYHTRPDEQMGRQKLRPWWIPSWMPGFVQTSAQLQEDKRQAAKKRRQRGRRVSDAEAQYWHDRALERLRRDGYVD